MSYYRLDRGEKLYVFGVTCYRVIAIEQFKCSYSNAEIVVGQKGGFMCENSTLLAGAWLYSTGIVINAKVESVAVYGLVRNSQIVSTGGLVNENSNVQGSKLSIKTIFLRDSNVLNSEWKEGSCNLLLGTISSTQIEQSYIDVSNAIIENSVVKDSHLTVVDGKVASSTITKGKMEIHRCNAYQCEWRYSKIDLSDISHIRGLTLESSKGFINEVGRMEDVAISHTNTLDITGTHALLDVKCIHVDVLKLNGKGIIMEQIYAAECTLILQDYASIRDSHLESSHIQLFKRSSLLSVTAKDSAVVLEDFAECSGALNKAQLRFNNTKRVSFS